ncbi:PhoD-like phosphatase-domain-containing protein [Crassisporium funariophilum]|nr:PhoD-like phosphatase-domain-containing protein [Crassisporium funariophilum]
MTLLQYLPALISSLFRIFTYIFLQIIPTRLAQAVLPAFYLLHLITTWICPKPNSTQVHGKGEKQLNGPVVRRKGHAKPLSTICFSLPTTSKRLHWLNISINTLLLLAAADLAVTPFFDTASSVVFTRMGAVYPDSVKLVVRYPNPNATEHTLLLVYREVQKNASDVSALWKDGPQLQLKEESDWVDTARLANLWPSTSYEYMLSTLNRTILPYPSAPIQFRTFPDPRLQSGSHFRFIASSCITPNFPYRGPLHRRTIRGYDLLADYIHSSSLPVAQEAFTEPIETSHPDEPQNDTVSGNVSDVDAQIRESKTTPITYITPPSTDFMLFLGDFIYADVPLYIGDDREAYRRLYRRNYESPSFKKIYESLPVFHAYDDHEFINNYGGEGKDIPPYDNASDAYNIYAGNANYDSRQPGQNFYDFQHGDIAFFVMDTRRYRSAATESDLASRTMLGDEQLSALYNWLYKVNETSTFKFIVSSVPFTSLWGHDAAIDSWAGFPSEKAALLNVLHSVPNVVILSGDRHEFAAIEFNTNDPNSHIVREFSTSPLSMFYIPFVHTLRMRSEESFISNSSSVDGSYEEVPYERAVAYLPKGNSKWSTFEIDTRDVEKPVLRIETVIDGQPAYHFEMVGVRVRPPNFTGLGSFVVTNVKDLFEKIGLQPRRWF